MLWSKKNSRYNARDHDRVITKQDSVRRALPTITVPKCAQSTWASSPT